MNAKISVTIITLNEERNIQRAIQSVLWANEIIIVDSGSTDKTLKIAKSYGDKIRIFHNNWQGYGIQKNIAQSKAKGEWVLNIDADEEVSFDLKNEIFLSIKNSEFTGYKIPRKSWFLGRWIMHGGWYPNYLLRLVKKEGAKWTEPCVHEELTTSGSVGFLKNDLLHYPFVSVIDQVLTNMKYASCGADDIIRSNKKTHCFQIIAKPIGKFIETYFIKKGFLDGIAGFIISINASHSIFIKYVLAYLKTK